ncbi:MAG: serine/threonine-protein kinase PknK [Myxococcales bacterium]|nr:serine/threonine-protein kinase PknK [Myxococcales bacterium]
MADEIEFSGTARFEVVRRLGAGGMGVVHEVLDRERNTRVALKTLRKFGADLLLRFKDEFRSLQDLPHPNLVRLLELFEESGRWFFTMELLDGVPLLEWVRVAAVAEPGILTPTEPVARSALGADDPPTVPGKRTPVTPIASASPGRLPARVVFNEARLRSSLMQLAEGLGALHAARKVHRDIKPSNILVTPEGRLVILDLGLVTDAAGHGQWHDDHLVGTYLYMAPEQAAARPVGPEADWYSVGVVLHLALTGVFPFDGPGKDVLRRKQREEPTPPRTLRPDLPEDLDRLCTDLLRLDPRRRPSATEVMRRLAADDAPPIPTASGTHFVGRRHELGRLRDAFAQTRVGSSVTLLIHGESGVGKSALMRRFTEGATIESQGTAVFAGRCHERESVPYKAVDGIIDALSRYLGTLVEEEVEALLPSTHGLIAQVFPVMRRVGAVAKARQPLAGLFDPQGLRTRLFAALRELFTRLAHRRPLVLVIDDLQWADADSLALLAEVMRPPRPPQLLLVATVRDGSPSGSSSRSLAEIKALLQGEVRDLHMVSLPREEAAELAELLLREARPGRAGDAGDGEAAVSATTIAEEAGGHPLFIDELVRSKLGGQEGPLRLEEALHARTARLSGPERLLLEIIAVAGAPLSQETAAHAAAMPFGTFSEHVARLRGAHLVKTGGVRRGDAIEPYHGRVREAVLGHLDGATLRERHQRLALALEAAGDADPEALAVHWRGAGEPERAASYTVRAAADAATKLAFDRAARLYRLSLAIHPPGGDEEVRLRTCLGDAFANAGRGADAAAVYLEAAPLAGSPSTMLELKRRAADQLLGSGHIDQGVAVLREVLEALHARFSETPRSALLSLVWSRIKVRLRGLAYRRREGSAISADALLRIDLFWSLAQGFAVVDTIRGADFQARSLLLALEAGEPYRITRAIAMEAGFTAAAGVPARRRTARLLAVAEELSKTITEPHAHGVTAAAGGFAAFLEGRWQTSLEHFEAAEKIFQDQCTGVAWELHTAQLYALHDLTYLGRLGDLARLYPIRLREAHERGNVYATTSLRAALPNIAWLVIDDPARARAELEEGMRAWSRQGFHLEHYWHLRSGGQIDLYAGTPKESHARISERWKALDRSLLLRIQVVRIEALDIRARSALAVAVTASEPERRRLLALAERDAKRIAREKLRWADPLADLLRAGIAAARGEKDPAASLLARAERGFEIADMALHATVARRRRGALLAGDEGRHLVATADAWMATQKVVRPDRITAMLAPGFGD